MCDYISREAAISKIRNEGILGGDYDAYEREEDVVNTLNSIPTADVVEVRHGRLLNPNPYGVCSVCGHLIDIRDSYNYCPNCGAKMDGGQDDV